MHPPDAPYQFHQSLPVNQRGRDFCVGDLHGEFSALERALDTIGFDPQRDRLFSVGDLIDRGPQSYRALEFLAQPWFYAVRGNHEAMLLDALETENIDPDWIIRAGADWWLEISAAERETFKNPFYALPYTIDIHTVPGKIGIVHADIPENIQWSTFTTQLPSWEHFREFALWSRKRINRILQHRRTAAVEGVNLLVVGHTPVPEALIVENVCFLDTGAVYAGSFKGAALTILEIHPEIHFHHFPTG